MLKTGRVSGMLALAMIVGTGQARADLISTTPYTLSISESQAVLANPGNQRVADMAATPGVTNRAVVRRSVPPLGSGIDF